MYTVFILATCFTFDIFNTKSVKKFKIHIAGSRRNGESAYHVETMSWYTFFNHHIAFFSVIFASDVSHEVVMFKSYTRKEHSLSENSNAEEWIQI